MTMKRQGDILLERVEGVAPAGRRIEDGVIARGETTGHAHRVQGADLLMQQSGQMVVDAPEGGRVVHEEHGPIELEPGVWLVHRQVEYVAPGEHAMVYD